MLINLHDMVCVYQMVFSTGISKRVKESANEYDPFYMVWFRSEIDKIFETYFSRKSQLDYDTLKEYMSCLKTIFLNSAILDEDIENVSELSVKAYQLYIDIEEAEPKAKIIKDKIVQMEYNLSKELKGNK